MSTANPITTDDRLRTFTVSASQTVFGPFSFKIYDIADVVLETRATVDDAWEAVTTGVTVTLTGTAPATFTVTKTGLATGLLGRVRGLRVPTRETNATRAGAISSQLLEDDLDKLNVVAQETRRDASLSLTAASAAEADAAAALAQVADLVAGTIPDGGVTTAKIADGTVTNAKLADMAQATIKGRAAGVGTGDPQDLTPAQARTAMGVASKEWFDIDIRDTAYAGGAPINGIDDDAPAIRAAINYAKTIGSLYNNVGVRINIPAGKIRLDSVDALSVAGLNVTDAHGVYIRGAGRGATQLVSSVTGYPVVKATNTTALPLHYFGIDESTIVGPGRSNAAAHGIDLGANNACRLGVKVWSCRSAFRLANSWQTTLDNIQVDGQGSIACYDGISMLDGNVAVAENAVIMLGGIIQAVERYSFRGECITGSKFVGAEFLGSGGTNVYLGDSPGNKDLKWATFVGCLVDTAPDLLVIKKGGSSVGELIHFSGCWLGYASEGAPGAGIGVEIDGMIDCQLGFDIIANTTYAALIKNCYRVHLRAGVVKDYDRILTGSAGLIIENSQRCRVDVGSAVKAAGSPAATALVENGTSDRNLITGIFDGTVSTVGANTNKVLTVVG